MLNRELLIGPEASIKDALRVLNKVAMKVLFVVDSNGTLLGSLSDGDVRRALLRNLMLDSCISEVFNSSPFCLFRNSFSKEEVKSIFLAHRIELIPILDETRRVVDLISWVECFGVKRQVVYGGPALNIPVVIMAGGKGTRLAPFTTVLPKPLIPIGEKTILELIMEEFLLFGVKQFHFTVNYRAEMIKAYFDGLEKKYPISYVREDDFYGTAGSLTLVAPYLSETFIVSNCDIIVKANYADVVAFHKSSNASLTVVSSLQHHRVPYGVVDFQAGGEVTGIREKPEFTFPINTGVYVLEKNCLDFVPPRKVFHMTHLIEALIAAGKKVVTYPVNEKEYIDIGQWEEYRQAVSQLSTSF